MKREKISVTTPDGYTVKVPAQLLATAVIAAIFGQTSSILPTAPAALPANTDSVPEVGEYWPGQGGHNAGFVPARDGVPAHYLIVAAKDIGDHKWGRYGEESGGTSRTDGLANTACLLNDGNHPAASACAEYQADGHGDFYLPAAAELYQCWLYTQHLFAKDCWYWSSTQRSANLAFGLVFGVGFQLGHGKDLELRVRPVRRLFI
ncbi:DUF1566 domain-containing protein [Pseudomonas toyotomiensis]|uniref:DUF1566 domain-containing protein n=1 Tax=Ectopseudomonas toyotomiensis TaxID=554344 RepID=A0AA42LL75_9GAMM|nr:DUF1566 domain-containing protein [Pseudomonas toyotomiensis]MDH0702123.1 DUF1566 domain-containing protein [Pseudomonas toyotomiensis]